MFELLLVALFTAFFLAVLDSLTAFLSMMVSAIAVNATFSLALSALGNVLVDTTTVKGFIIKTVAGAFLGKSFLATTERLTVYRHVTVGSARQP
jgi:hypothetical protein